MFVPGSDHQSGWLPDFHHSDEGQGWNSTRCPEIMTLTCADAALLLNLLTLIRENSLMAILPSHNMRMARHIKHATAIRMAQQGML
jgi:hypothetical protein